MKYIIGVIGENGAGKGTFSDLLLTKSTSKSSKIKFSDVLFATLNNWDIPTTRANLQNLTLAMEKQFGEGTLTRATKKFIQKKTADIIVVEGMRWKSDVTMIRSFKNNAIVYITAKPKIRFERMRNRGEKVGENNLTYAQFLKEEKAGTELMIKKIGKQADFVIENNGNLSDMKRQVEKFYKRFILSPR